MEVATTTMLRAGRVGVTLTLALTALLAHGCAHKKKRSEVPGVLSAAAVYRQARAELERGHLRKVRTLLERVQYGEEREELEPKVRLAIADATFYQGYSIALIDARALYLDFVTLYGQRPEGAYAQFQAGMCSFAQIGHPSKDQTPTHQAIADFRQVLERYPGSPFAEAARGMIRQGEKRLAEHEFLVGRFYLKRKKPLAAVGRFRTILDRYPHYEEKDKLYFYLGQALLRSNNQSEARIYLDKLVTDYPDGRYVDEAIKELDKVGGRLDVDLSGSP